MKNAYDRKFKKQNETGQKQFNDFFFRGHSVVFQTSLQQPADPSSK